MKVSVAARARGVLIIAGMFGYVVRKIAHTAFVTLGVVTLVLPRADDRLIVSEMTLAGR